MLCHIFCPDNDDSPGEVQKVENIEVDTTWKNKSVTQNGVTWKLKKQFIGDFYEVLRHQENLDDMFHQISLSNRFIVIHHVLWWLKKQ